MGNDFGDRSVGSRFNLFARLILNGMRDEHRFQVRAAESGGLGTSGGEKLVRGYGHRG